MDNETKNVALSGQMAFQNIQSLKEKVENKTLKKVTKNEPKKSGKKNK